MQRKIVIHEKVGFMRFSWSIFAGFFKKNQLCPKTGVLLLYWGAIGVAFSCSSKVASDIPKDLISNKKIPSVEAFNFQTFYTDSGVVRYFLKTPRLLIFDREKSPYKEFPEGFHLQQFDTNKKIISELSANYGKNFEKEEKWLATGNVVMVNNKGDTLRSEELIYLIKEDKIYSEKFVNIKKEDQDISGTGGFVSDSQMKKWSFIKTSGHIYITDQNNK